MSRQAFEAWVRTVDKSLSLHKVPDGGYKYPRTKSAWSAWRSATAAALAAPATESEQDQCKWKFDDDESNTWASQCGELWTYIDGGPEENRVKYCHGCGKPVVLEDKP